MISVAVIPVKSFALGKQRLSSALDGETRARLGRALAEHVASTMAMGGLMPLIVTADPDVAEWARGAGFASLTDPGTGLDEAAAAGREWALEEGRAWMVVHSDLPLLHPSDVAALSGPLSRGRTVIAPSADGGTAAIGATTTARFSFGNASFHRHLRDLNDPVIVARPGLLLDIDSPRDLDAAATTSRGRWLVEVTGLVSGR